MLLKRTNDIPENDTVVHENNDPILPPSSVWNSSDSVLIELSIETTEISTQVVPPKKQVKH